MIFVNSRRRRYLLAPLLLLLGAACAQSNGDIDRVHPGYVRKADLLEGTWYLRHTVTGAPAGTGFTFTGETGALEKVVWDVQEDALVGYRAYPFIVGAGEETLAERARPSGTTVRLCGAGPCVGGHPFYGAPLVRYRIERHFDVRRTFDPVTGEQGNVIEENTSDRPWNEREYIRVDWSQSELARDTGLMWGTLGNAAAGSSLSTWIQEGEQGTDPDDWPHAEYAEGPDKRLVYLDFTARHLASPDEVDIPGYGAVPVCWLRGGERYDCTSQEIRVRTSLSRVDRDAELDYEPLPYDDSLMAKFGYFRTERLAYDRELGYTDARRVLLANRWNLWQHSFDRGADGKAPLRTDAQGQVLNRRLELGERQPRPLVYFLTPRERVGDAATYAAHLEAARALEASWDGALRRAVAAAQTSGAPLTPEQVRARVPQMLYVCETPVPAGAPAACGPEGFRAHFGDLRYSFLTSVTEPTPNGLLGYGPLSADPETGEILSAHANVYGAAVDLQAQVALDMVDLLAGDVSVADHLSGAAARRYLEEHSSYAEAFARMGRTIPAAGATAAAATASVGLFQRPTSRTAELLAGLRAGGGLPEARGAAGGSVAAAAERLQSAPALQAALVGAVPGGNAGLLSLLPPELTESAVVDPARLAAAAPLAVLSPEQLAALRERRLDEASRHNLYLAEFMDDQMYGLAMREHRTRALRINALQAQGRTLEQATAQANDELRSRLRIAIWRAVGEHEFGHTLGLRHNFAGSFDAVNYRDRFWELRRDTLTVRAGAEERVPLTPEDLRATSHGTLAQLEEGLHEHAYSSIMDYGGAINADFHGLGRYDEAALLFGYSGGSAPGYVEVFTGGARASPRSFPASDGTTLTLNGAARDLPLINAQHVSPGVPHFTERFHYTTLPLRLGEGQTTGDVIDSGLQRLRQRGLMPWAQVKAHYAELRERLAASPNATADGLDVPLEVPYLFCTDDHVGAVLSCNRFDRGPDYYEMTRAWLESYWSSYYFNHFRRDRYSFSAASAFRSAYGTFLNTGLVYKQLLHALYDAQDASHQGLPNYSRGPLGYDPVMQATWTMGAVDGVNQLLRAVQVPTPGFYALQRIDLNRNGAIGEDLDGDGAVDEAQWSLLTEQDTFDSLTLSGMLNYTFLCPYMKCGLHYAVLARGEARRTYSRYDVESGYGFENRVLEVGHYNDQLGALFAAVADPYSVPLGADGTSDVRRYALPYSLLFKDELEGTFGALWSADEEPLRPTLAAAGAGPYGDFANDAKPEWQDKVHAERYFAGFTYPPAPAALPAGTKRYPMDVELTWATRIYSLYLGMAGFSVTGDLDFARQNQVVKLGGAEGYTPAPGYEQLVVEDFRFGTRYLAVKPQGAAPTPAWRMVARAEELAGWAQHPESYPGLPPSPSEAQLAQVREQATDSFAVAMRELDVMRGFYGVFGTP